MTTVEARIRAALGDAPYEIVDHAPVTSAVGAAQARGTALETGAKGIVMKLDRIGFAVLAIRADQRIDGKHLRRAFGIQRYRFASADELAARTGLGPGEVPPFGRPVLDLPLYVDAALAAGARMAFTVGRRDRSFLIAVPHWLAAARPAQVVPLTPVGIAR